MSDQPNTPTPPPPTGDLFDLAPKPVEWTEDQKKAHPELATKYKSLDEALRGAGEMQKEIGRLHREGPKAPDKYTLPEDIKLGDAETALMKDMGLTNGQAEKFARFMSAATGKMSDMQKQLQVAELKRHYGDNYVNAIANAKRFVDEAGASLPPEIRALAGSSHEAIKIFDGLQRANVQRQQTPDNTPPAAIKVSDEDIFKFMRTPEYRTPEGQMKAQEMIAAQKKQKRAA